MASFDSYSEYLRIANARSRAQLLRSGAGPSEADKMIRELAVASMEELIRMAQAGEPLWTRSSDNTIECLSEDEYSRNFPGGLGPKHIGLKTEASRDSAVVIMDQTKLVGIMMDVNQWSTLFTGIVTRASTFDVLSTGVAGNFDGALQVMTAEFQVLSPLVPTRSNSFVRYCKKHDNGTWAVVDVSLGSMHHASASRCRRRPSGCLIQELPNGCSKVTWVEHVEVDDSGVHDIYRSLVNSGLAFGAKRWVTTLRRQCERLLNAMPNDIPTGNFGVISTPQGRSMLKLAERMVSSFCTGINDSIARIWTTLCGSGVDDARQMMRHNTDLGAPPGMQVSAATSIWIPVPPKRVFDFLRDKNSRSLWDIMTQEGPVQEVAHIAKGRDPGNCVSLLCVNGARSSLDEVLILQETFADATGSYVIFAAVDSFDTSVVLSGDNPDYIDVLPSGFAILPDGPGQNVGGILEVGSGGTLLTVAFQILVDSAKITPGAVATVNSLIRSTTERIKSAVMCDPKF